MLSESLAWMGHAVEGFGLAHLDVRLLLEWLKADLGSTNAGVRNAATALAGVCHRQLGPGLAGQLREHVKPALMSALEDTFAANPQQPVRSLAQGQQCAKEEVVMSPPRQACFSL